MKHLTGIPFTLKRPGTGINGSSVNLILGRSARRDILCRHNFDIGYDRMTPKVSQHLAPEGMPGWYLPSSGRWREKYTAFSTTLSPRQRLSRKLRSEALLPTFLYACLRRSIKLALGDNVKRQEAFHQLQQWGFFLPPLLHPRANIEVDAQVGEGTVVCLGAMLGTESVVGRGSITSQEPSSTMSHPWETFHIAPGAVIAGRTHVGDRVFVGMNACIADGLRVGDNSIIGAGSVVLADVPEGAKILGIHH